MTKDEELQNLKRQVQENLDRSRKRSLRTSIALILMALTTMISITYAFIQQTQAVKAKNEAVANAEEAQRQHILAELNAKMAEKQREMAEDALKKCDELNRKESK